MKFAIPLIWRLFEIWESVTSIFAYPNGRFAMFLEDYLLDLNT